MNNRIIWTNGCFDVIHRGHVECLKYAKSLGGYLFVGVDTDERVKELKGEDRPFNNLVDRVMVLQSIKYVDSVITFGSDETLNDLIKGMQPHYLVKGSDYIGKKIIGAEHAKHVVYFDLIEGHSTTNILKTHDTK